jgi:hypothetical protein
MKPKKDVRVYPALLSEEGRFVNVRFPDLPGCNTFGEGYADRGRVVREARGTMARRAGSRAGPALRRFGARG